MSCTIINSNANIATGNDMKEYRRGTYVPYSGKLSRERTFMNFAVVWLFVKAFSAKFGNEMFFGTAKLSNPQKFSLRKFVFHQFVKVFSLESFLLYSICRIKSNFMLHLDLCTCKRNNNIENKHNSIHQSYQTHQQTLHKQ